MKNRNILVMEYRNILVMEVESSVVTFAQIGKSHCVQEVFHV